ncbi:MAG TPA: PaaI family thioesterase [Thermoanaerobaculia bacterium]|nr:PaaI family thioesterase [Thermoanaerobaculia bacterium]
MTALADFVRRWQEGEVTLAPITELLGVRPRSLGDGRAEVEMDATARLHNAMGILHGGVLVDLADVAIGVALATAVEEGETFSTLQSGITYLRPVQQGRLVAAARVVQRGRTIAHMECEIRDDRERPVARITSSLVIRRLADGE